MRIRRRNIPDIGIAKNENENLAIIDSLNLIQADNLINSISILEMAEPYLIIRQKKLRAQIIINNYKARDDHVIYKSLLTSLTLWKTIDIIIGKFESTN